MSKKRVAIFGSTGSIGRNTLEVIAALPDQFEVSYLSTNGNVDLLAEQARLFKPKGVAVVREGLSDNLRKRISSSTRLFQGEEGLNEMARASGTDIVVSALVGFAGVGPTVEAIRSGKDIALANKETLVAAGAFINELVGKHGVRLLPVDSEHSAILQCLTGERPENVARLILTASGGPFRELPAEGFAAITVEEALKHPNWSMGKKITIDSATLMNKGLEVIEAHWLFGLPPERIEVVIHPQSVIHSMVEFVDGSVKAQLGVPDMKGPIQYALTYPERMRMNGRRVDFPNLREMTFSEPDLSRFPALRLAYDALKAGGTAPAVLNAANEIAVHAFLERKISFRGISEILERTMERVPSENSLDLESILAADRLAREISAGMIGAGLGNG